MTVQPQPIAPTLVSVLGRAARRRGQAWGRLGLCAVAGLAMLLGPVEAAGPAPADAPVTLHYVVRPPYMVAQGDALVGLTGRPSFQAFQLAQIPVRIEQTPFARQLRVLQENTGKDCMIGMFRKPDREAFGRYSKPVYQDQPQLVLAAAGQHQRLRRHASIEDLFNDRSLRLLVKLAYSYGAPLDALIERLQPHRRTTPDENLQMIRQIKMGMADYLLIAPEEAAGAIEAAGYPATEFVQLRLANMPPGEPRHLLCSKKVPVEVMRRLDAAIKKITAKEPWSRS